MNTQLIKFYTENGKDHAGRVFGDLIQFNNKELEDCHDYIQWLFPTETRSQFNLDTPTLDQETAVALFDNEVFHVRFQESIKVMLAFWGFKCSNSLSGLFLPKHSIQNWMLLDDHNLLRMTRFMESCRLLGYQQVATKLFEVLLALANSTTFITIENIFYWYHAALGKVSDLYRLHIPEK